MRNILKPSAICLVFAVVAISWSACKNRKKIVSEDLSIITADNYVKVLQAKASGWTLFSSKLKVEYIDGGSSMTANASLRMKRDSLIWMSVSVLGFEAARVLITQDSFFIMQKMPQKHIEANSIDVLGNYIGTAVSLTQLQNLLLGNTILEPRQYRWSDSPDEGIFYLKGRKDSIEVAQRYYFKNIVPIDAFIRSLTVYNKATITYQGTQKTNLKDVPAKCSFKIEYSPESQPISVNIDFQSPEFPTNLTFPFSKPTNNE